MHPIAPFQVGYASYLERTESLHSGFQPNCVSLQETMLGTSHLPSERHHACLGGSVIHISTNCRVFFSHLNVKSSLEVLHGLIDLHRLYITYLLIHFVSFLHYFQFWVFLVDDTLCGMTFTNRKRNILLAAVNDFDIHIFNTGARNHFHSPVNFFPVLDFSICLRDALMKSHERFVRR